MLKAHRRHEADVTIAAIPVSREDGSRFGVLEVDDDGRIVGFHEKVENPPTIPGDPDRCYASMGNYVFSAGVLERVLVEDQADPNSTRDFGHDILPKMVAAGERVFFYTDGADPGYDHSFAKQLSLHRDLDLEDQVGGALGAVIRLDAEGRPEDDVTAVAFEIAKE